MTRHQFGISALRQTSFRGKTNGDVANNVGCFLRLILCLLFCFQRLDQLIQGALFDKAPGRTRARGERDDFVKRHVKKTRGVLVGDGVSRNVIFKRRSQGD